MNRVSASEAFSAERVEDEARDEAEVVVGTIEDLMSKMKEQIGEISCFFYYKLVTQVFSYNSPFKSG